MPISPSDLSGLVGWYAPDSIATDGGPTYAHTWYDKSGQGNDATTSRGSPNYSDPNLGVKLNETFVVNYTNFTNIPTSASVSGWHSYFFGEFNLPDTFDQNTFSVTITINATGNEQTPTAEYSSINIRKVGGGATMSFNTNPQNHSSTVSGSYPTIYYTNTQITSSTVTNGPFVANDRVEVYLTIFRRWYSVYNLDVSISYTGISAGLNGHKFVYGSTYDGYSFPSTLMNDTSGDYTLFHVAKYYNPNGLTTRKRIFDGGGNINWLSGFHSGNTGVAYHNGWLTNTRSDLHGDDWFVSTDQNALYRSNTVKRNDSSGGSASSILTINAGYFTGERSDWAVAEVIVYDRLLSPSEYFDIEEYLYVKYGFFDDYNGDVVIKPLPSVPTMPALPGAGSPMSASQIRDMFQDGEGSLSFSNCYADKVKKYYGYYQNIPHYIVPKSSHTPNVPEYNGLNPIRFSNFRDSRKEFRIQVDNYEHQLDVSSKMNLYFAFNTTNYTYGIPIRHSGVPLKILIKPNANVYSTSIDTPALTLSNDLPSNVATVTIENYGKIYGQGLSTTEASNGKKAGKAMVLGWKRPTYILNYGEIKSGGGTGGAGGAGGAGGGGLSGERGAGGFNGVSSYLAYYYVYYPYFRYVYYVQYYTCNAYIGGAGGAGGAGGGGGTGGAGGDAARFDPNSNSPLIIPAGAGGAGGAGDTGGTGAAGTVGGASPYCSTIPASVNEQGGPGGTGGTGGTGGAGGDFGMSGSVGGTGGTGGTSNPPNQNFTFTLATVNNANRGQQPTYNATVQNWNTNGPPSATNSGTVGTAGTAGKPPNRSIYYEDNIDVTYTNAGIVLPDTGFPIHEYSYGTYSTTYLQPPAIVGSVPSGYSISVESGNSSDASNVFDRSPSTFAPGSPGFSDNAWTGVPTHFKGVGSYYGPWVRLDLPYSTKLAGMVIRPQDTTNGGQKIRLFGSNDGDTWFLVFYTDDTITYSGTTNNMNPTVLTFNTLTTQKFSKYVYTWIENTTTTGTYNASLAQWNVIIPSVVTPITEDYKGIYLGTYDTTRLEPPVMPSSGYSVFGHSNVPSPAQSEFYNAFDRSASTYTDSYYTFVDYEWTGPTITFNGVGTFNGPWLRVDLPFSAPLQGMVIRPQAHTNGPQYVTLMGSNDGTTWTQLYYISGITYTGPNQNNMDPIVLRFNTDVWFSKYAMVWTRVGWSGTYTARVAQWNLIV